MILSKFPGPKNTRRNFKHKAQSDAAIDAVFDGGRPEAPVVNETKQFNRGELVMKFRGLGRKESREAIKKEFKDFKIFRR
jgi:hypothetical protein